MIKKGSLKYNYLITKLCINIFYATYFTKKIHSKAGPIAERFKSSPHGRGGPGSNPGEGGFFSDFFQDVELS